MNCREIAEILDNRKTNLDPLQRREAQAHMATCAECASAWNLQVGLADLPGMALPANFSSRCRLLVAAASPSTVRRPAIIRRVLAGSLTALAAAAALLLIYPRQSSVTLPVVSQRTALTVDAATSIVQAAAESASVELRADPPQPEVIEVATTSRFLVRVMPLTPAINAQGAAADPLMKGLRTATQEQVLAFVNDPAGREAMQSLHTALVEELRRIPGLVLVDSDLAALEPASSRKYQVRVSMPIMFSPDGTTLLKSNRHVTVVLRAEQVRSNGQAVNRLSSSAVIDLQAPCMGAAPVADTPCADARGTAATLVRQLRERVFPPAASATRALQAKFQDSSLGVAQRWNLLAELLRIRDNTDDMSLLRDPGVVRAAIELAANSDPAMRARIWRSMRGVGSRELTPALMNSLVNDSGDVRLAAVETLADFRDDAQVRATLESVALGDSRPLVRAVAERTLSGEESWKRYVVASLKDSSRPAPDRLEALAYYLYPPAPAARSPDSSEYWQTLEMLDDSAVTAMAEALPGAGSLQGNADILMANFAGTHIKNPVVTDMLLNVLAHHATPKMRRGAGQVLARAHRNEPRVRDALTKAIESDPDPGVRDWIRQVVPAAAEQKPIF
jgi:hypothetical protein